MQKTLKFLLLFISNFTSVMRYWKGIETFSSFMLSVYKLNLENTQMENICDIVF